MRHSVAGYTLGRRTGARIALRRNLIKQFFTHERIQTTKAKAAAIRGDAERLITLARNSANGTEVEKLNARRLAISRLAITNLSSVCLMRLPPALRHAPVVTPVCTSLVHATAMRLRWYFLSWLKSSL